MNNPTTQNITILHDTKEWSTDLDGEIGEIRIDGQKLNDIHDLAIKLDRITTIIKALAFVATFLAVIAVAGGGFVCSWIAVHHEQITQTMDTTKVRFSKRINLLQNQSTAYAKKLTELGWGWKDGKWQQFANMSQNASK